MPRKPTVSLVIPNHNGGPLLMSCIESIRRNTQDYEIIVVDNNSTDGCLARVRVGYDVKIIKLPYNFGFARASNIGIKTSSGTYVVLLNSDTRVTPSWLERLVATGEQSSAIGLVTPKLLRLSNPAILDSTGHLYQYDTGLCKDRGSDEVDQGQYDRSTELVSCCFACVLIKRRVFELIGLLDEKMFIYYEDVDFCLRARIAGMRVVYCPRSIVYHLHGGSTPGMHRKQQLDKWQGYPLRIFLKNYELKNAILYGGRWWFLELLRVAAGLKNRDKDYVKHYAQPIIWNVMNLPLRERIVSQMLRKLSDEEIFESS